MLTRRSDLFHSVLLIAVSGLMSVGAIAGTGEEFPRFEGDVLPIFQSNCLACHGENVRQADLDLRQRDTALKGGESGPALVPGSASTSLLFEKISSGAMPLGKAKLDTPEIELIRDWIDAGALSVGEEPDRVPEQREARRLTTRDVLVPILSVRCVICHGRRKQEGGLDLRTRASLLKGGKSGAAVIPGQPDESLLIKRIVAEEMPPPKSYGGYGVRPVTTNELEKLRQWISQGAPEDPDEAWQEGSDPESLVKAEDRLFWSFRSPERPDVPQVESKNSVPTPIDAFLLEKLEAKGLGFSPSADRLALMRRAYFDLIGLPPAPEEIERYRHDPSSLAYEKMIDRLLASPRYGERWARHWLDAVGYADSEGKVDSDSFRHHAYRYRNYVIRSFNQDKPYDQFLLEQIAGDELFDYRAGQEKTPEQWDYLVATGFLRMAPDGTYSGAQNFVPERLDVVADTVEILSSAVMGLTLACARCHSHKYDPISLRDYYRFSAILRSAYDPYDWRTPTGPLSFDPDAPFPLRSLPYPSESERREMEIYNAPIQEEVERLENSLKKMAEPLKKMLLEEKLKTIPENLRHDLREVSGTPVEQRTELQKYLAEKFKTFIEVTNGELERRFEDYRQEAVRVDLALIEPRGRLRSEPMVRVLFDMGGEPTPTFVLRRGSHLSPGSRVQPGVPSVLSDGIAPYKVVKPLWDTSGRRLALARWLTQPKQPLTARVMVNRIWQHHFGTGLVATPGNFGHTGARPTHPELLDWLATEFVRRGWSVKAMHRLIMTSNVYRQSSAFDPDRHAADPENELLSRFPFRRLEAEAIRDSILQVAGRLDTTPFGRADEVEVEPDGEVNSKCSPKGCRRSIYMLQRRTRPLTMLDAFDAPQLNPNCVKRRGSNVSSQALTLWNSSMVRQNSLYFAGRVIDAVGSDLARQVDRVYLTALARRPSDQERERAERDIMQLTQYWLQHLNTEVPEQPRRLQSRWQALATFCHSVLNSAEFIYID